MGIEELAGMAGRLFRSPDGERRYAAMKKRVAAKYASHDDYIKIRHLGFKRRMRADGKIEAAAHEGVRAVHFGPNEFPYAGIGQGVEHYVLFSLVALSKKQIDALLSAYLPEGCARSHYVNPPGSRSVQGVWHAHVFFERP